MHPRQKRMLILLGVMSLATFGGPVAVGFLLRGGASPDWPPDRPVEWAGLLITAGVVLACLLSIVAIGLVHRRELVDQQRANSTPAGGPAR